MTMQTLFAWTGLLLAALALCGAGYAMLAALLMSRFMRRANQASGAGPVSVLKPLCGMEPGLEETLESLFVQDLTGPMQIVFGAQDEDDPALAVVRTLQARYPDHDTEVVVSGARHGTNAKMSNIINMLPAARYDTLVLSDSDIRVPTDWLAHVTGALARPGVGAVTCLYRGEAAEDGLWSTLAAMGTSYDFLPNAVVGLSLGLAHPCMGSTVALSRAILAEIGGFSTFADRLADDYAIGRAVRGLGRHVAVLPPTVVHRTVEASAGTLFRHELRWMRTIRGIDPAGHLGSCVTFAVPLALLAAVFLGLRPDALLVLALALGARLFLKRHVDGIFQSSAGSAWLLPLRDLLGFTVFVTSLWGGTVHWRGRRLSVDRGGVIPPPESIEAAQ